MTCIHRFLPLLTGFLLSLGLLASAQDYIVHHVEPGQSAVDIAREYMGGEHHVSLLMQINNLESHLSINEGDRIFVPRHLGKTLDMEELARKHLSAGIGRGIKTLAPDEYRKALACYEEAIEKRERADFYAAITSSTLCRLYVDKAVAKADATSVEQLDVTLLKKHGTVERSANGGVTWETLASLGTARASELIRTGPRSVAHLGMPDGSVYELAEKTSIEIVRLSRDRRDDARDTELSLLSGEYLAKVKKAKGADNISLRSSGLAIVIRGTVVRLSRQGQHMGLAVTEGSTLSRAGETEQPVEQGEGLAVLRKGDGFDVDKFELPPAPAVADRFANLKANVRQVNLAWTLPATADAAFFELAADESFTHLLANEEIRGNSVRTPRLEQGTYFWRVNSVRNQIKGAYSPLQRLDVKFGLEFDVRPVQPFLKKVGREVVGRNTSGPGNTLVVHPRNPDNAIFGSEYSLDGGPFQTMDAYRVPVPREAGDYRVAIRVFTEEGRRTEAVETAFTVDAEPPATTYQTRKEANSVVLEFTATDDQSVDRIEVRRHDGKVEVFKGDRASLRFRRTLGGSFELRAVDAFGNASPFKSYRVAPVAMKFGR